MCSLPQRVTIGTHTVQELAENDYVLEDGAGATAPWTISDVTCSGCRQPAARIYDVTNATLFLGFGFTSGRT